MKKIIFYILCCTSAIHAQTLIPDVNFEQALIDLNLDSGAPDGLVATQVINQVLHLDVHALAISDLTGIEDFAALETLDCGGNDIQDLDLSNLNHLKRLDCYDNQLSSLDVGANLLLERLDCSKNQISELNVANNPQLIDLTCDHNQLSVLDVSTNGVLENLFCYKNELTFLNVKNGNNTILKNFHAGQNQLDCIQVDNAAEATAHTGVYGNWVYDNDEGTEVEYVENCLTPLAVEWLSFVLTKKGTQALLEWRIASNQSIEYFGIEHSEDGHDFHQIGEVRALGLAHYEYLHRLPRKGANYYRLRVLEKNGQSEYSSVMPFYLDRSEEELLLFPNPAQDRLLLSMSSEVTVNAVRIYNQIGEEVFFSATASPQIDIQHLPKGIYVLEVSLQGKKWRQSFVK